MKNLSFLGFEIRPVGPRVRGVYRWVGVDGRFGVEIYGKTLKDLKTQVRAISYARRTGLIR
jgi:hypothetical protein